MSIPTRSPSFGTLCTVAGGVIYATGHIRTGGWFLGLTALFDVLDGTVARRSNRSSTFGAFLDSTLDRVADGVVLGGLAVFYATSPAAPQRADAWSSCLLGLIGAFLTSYIRARAEALGLDAKVGHAAAARSASCSCRRRRRSSASCFNGWVLAVIIVILTVTAWITVVQRMVFVYRRPRERTRRQRAPMPGSPPKSFWLRRRRRTGTRPLLKGE